VGHNGSSGRTTSKHNPWRHVGGGCNLETGECDEEFEHLDSQQRVSLSTTWEAHRSLPTRFGKTTDDLVQFVEDLPGVEFASEGDRRRALHEQADELIRQVGHEAWFMGVGEGPEGEPIVLVRKGHGREAEARLASLGRRARLERRDKIRALARNPDDRRTQVMSFGGGVDSMCMLVDAMQRGELPDVVVFMDVGDPDHMDPAEWPETYAYITEVVQPLLSKLGIEFVWMTSEMYPIRDARSLYQWFRDRGQVPLSGPDHLCSVVAKVERFEKWMQDRFKPGQKIDVWIGFAKGEEARAARDPHGKQKKRRKPKKGELAPVERHNRFPLIERELTREDCIKLIAHAGYKVPRKSACVFCPYGQQQEWEEFARRFPEQFKKIMALERDKDLTTRGYKIYIQDFAKFGLSKAQYRVMSAIREGEREFKGRDKKTLAALKERSWVAPDNSLTSYGTAILDEAGPNWAGPPKNPKGKQKSDDPDLVERAAIGGCVRHQQLTTREDGLSKYNYQALDALARGEDPSAFAGQVKGAYNRLKKKGEYVSKKGELTNQGRAAVLAVGLGLDGYDGPPFKTKCVQYERKPILGVHYKGTPIEVYSGAACSATTEEDELNRALVGDVVPVSALTRKTKFKVAPQPVELGEQMSMFNAGRRSEIKRKLLK